PDRNYWINPSGGSFQSLSVGRDALGQDEAYLLDNSGRLQVYDQGAWTAPQDDSSFVVVAAGHAEAFLLDASGRPWVFHDSAGLDASGQDEVSLLDGNGGLWRYDQGNWSGPQNSAFVSANAGQGETVLLDAPGNLWIYPDGGSYTNFFSASFQSLSIGQDAFG